MTVIVTTLVVVNRMTDRPAFRLRGPISRLLQGSSLGIHCSSGLYQKRVLAHTLLLL